MGVALVIVLLAAVVCGAALLAVYVRGGRAHMLRRLHAALALGGVALAAWALGFAAAPVATITWEGLALGVAASGLGLLFWLRAGRLGPSGGMLMAVHAMLGAAGAVILAVWAAG